jgi:hypothetical protein
VKTTNNHMGQGLESREDVPTPASPNVTPDFALHEGDEVLHCPGAKWYHAPAVLVVYGEEPASRYPARVSSNMGHLPWCQLARDGQAQAHFS